MNRNTIRLLIILGLISIVFITAIQIYWVRRAFDIQDQKFNQTVNIALRNVAYQIANLYKAPCEVHPVQRETSDYYVVNVNTPLEDNEILETFLKEEFKRHNLNTEFEYGIYSCENNKMAYGAYIKDYNEVNPNTTPRLPLSNKFLYYFGVRFPKHSSFLIGKLDIWIVSSLITLIVLSFFVYAMRVVLRQKRLSEVQRDFVNNMTHEFQTPIATIKVAADVLGQKSILDSPERLKKYVQIIKHENNRLKNQVEAVLNVAKLDKGQMVLNLEPADIHQLIHENTQGLQAEHADNFKLDLRATKTIVNIDKVHISNVLNNLLDNAVKYSNGHVDISVITENTEFGLKMTISDKGIGIPVDAQNMIFDKFYRVPTGNVHNVKGFGLGLNYVRQIAHAHKWKLSLKSEPGKGTDFIINISQP